MKLRLFLAVNIALAAGACGQSSTTPGSPASSAAVPLNGAMVAPSVMAMPTSAETGTSAGATPAATGPAPTKAFMVGKWDDHPDCSKAIQFNADGSMVGPFKSWDLKNGELSMAGNESKVQLVVTGPDAMESRLDGKGPPHHLKRCK